MPRVTVTKLRWEKETNVRPHIVCVCVSCMYSTYVMTRQEPLNVQPRNADLRSSRFGLGRHGYFVLFMTPIGAPEPETVTLTIIPSSAVVT
jgi:hypothetical protein